jgi:hypothetical protein
MPTPRTVTRQIVPQPTMEGAGVKLNRLIAGRQLDWVDPFLPDHFGSTIRPTTLAFSDAPAPHRDGHLSLEGEATATPRSADHPCWRRAR